MVSFASIGLGRTSDKLSMCSIDHNESSIAVFVEDERRYRIKDEFQFRSLPLDFAVGRFDLRHISGDGEKRCNLAR